MKNKYEIEYLPSAQKDIIDIVDYIKLDNPSAALNFVDKLDDSISKLADFPLIGIVPKDSRLQLLNYRMLIVDNYLVIYVLKDNTVEIRRVIHGKRKYDFLL